MSSFGIMDGGTLMMQLTQSSDTDQVNLELIAYLAKVLEILTAAIEIAADQKCTDKLVVITGLSADIVQESLLKSAGLAQAKLDRRRQNSSANRHEP